MIETNSSAFTAIATNNFPERKLESTLTTFTKIEFDKNNLFFRSTPNKISYDKVKIKNTGTTCIYFKWQKYVKPFTIPDKKSEGIDRFFCHYSDSKLFPDEERTFTFSFFSEKNGVFSEDWILVTSPPIKTANLVIHLNGMCLELKDKYSDPIAVLDEGIERRSAKTMIHEMVLDLVSTIKETDPPLPDMNDPEVFKFYFLMHNKEYNVEFSKYIMQECLSLVRSIHQVIFPNEEVVVEKEELKNDIQNDIQNDIIPNDIIQNDIIIPNNNPTNDDPTRSQIQPPNNPHWNGSLDEIKILISKIEDEEIKSSMTSKLNTLIHLSRRKHADDSLLKDYIREKILELALDFNDITNSVREEMQIPPYTFDLLTKQSLNEKELTLYEKEANKRKDEFYKKSKKKPPKPEEEEKEINDYKLKAINLVKEKFLEKFQTIETDKLEYTIDNLALNSIEMDEDYIDRLARVKCLRTAKNEGLEGKTAILRVDIEEFIPVYEDVYDEDNNLIDRVLKEIKFPSAKESILQTMFFLLDNRVKAVVLLVDFGPKFGMFHPDFKIKYFKDYIEPFVEQTIYSLNSIEEVFDLQRKIDADELFKDNSLFILENLNFFPEECGFEFENDPFLSTQPGQTQMLKLYNKNKFIDYLSLRTTEDIITTQMALFKNQIFINDSPNSILKKYPSVIDMPADMLRCLGMRIETQFLKISNFLSINSHNFMLIIGDMDNEEDTMTDQTILSSLLTLNCLLLKFKKIFILGKLGIFFIQFIQNEYTIHPEYKFSKVFHKLVKYILVRAELNQVKIVFPEDGRIIKKSEYEKFKRGLVNINNPSTNVMNSPVEKSEIQSNENSLDNINNNKNDSDNDNDNPDFNPNIPSPEDYFKYIKKLSKMEKRMNELIALNLEPEDLADNEDYLKNKITEEHVELLTNYKHNTIEFQTENYRKDFINSQSISKPKKVLKNELEMRNYLEHIYHKEITYPVQFENTSINNNSQMSVSNPLTEINNNSIPISNSIINNEEYLLFDYGDKTYDTLTSSMNEMNCVMWLGRLAPSIVENLYDNYSKVVRTIYERKQKLRSEFNDLMQEEEKKLHETDLKAKKYLFSILVKSKSSYDQLRQNFLTFMLPAEEKDQEVPPDEEQFNYEMNNLIDCNIIEDFDFINAILMGRQIPGFYGVSQEGKKEKEPELDLKFLEDIY